MEKQTLRTFFPAPKFLAMPAIGLEISDRFLRFVELSATKTGPIIDVSGEIPIPEGVVVSGDIKKAPELTKILATFKKNTKATFVHVSLPEEHSYISTLHIPRMKKSEMRGNIELQLEDNVPISPSDAVFDYDIIEKNKQGSSEVSLSVFPRAMTEVYLSILQDAGLTPLSFEIESSALVRAVVPHGDKRAFMIMNVGTSNTKISIVSGEVVQFTSTLPIGGLAFTNIFKKNFVVGKGEEKKMQAKGISAYKDNESVFLALVSVVAVLRDEIYRHHSYWKNHKSKSGKNDHPDIERVILCGEGVGMPDVFDYLASGLEIPLSLADITTNISPTDDHVPIISFSDSLRFATVLGLALRGYV